MVCYHKYRKKKTNTSKKVELESKIRVNIPFHMEEKWKKKNANNT